MSERPQHNAENTECQCFKCHIQSVGFGKVPGGANDTRNQSFNSHGVKQAKIQK